MFESELVLFQSGCRKILEKIHDLLLIFHDDKPHMRPLRLSRDL